ncbi:hypothetical protein [Nocardia sp. CA-135398]|uniref:hypothetical protein n=1 Tax=Nocardia sp. CA-135398 TaxID=3239977 RepID=UPI003D97A8CE
MSAPSTSKVNRSGKAAVVDCLLLSEIESAVKGRSLALMLYGSQARGSADDASDVDVLQLVARRPRSYRVGRVAVTAYTASQLHHMAQSGGLFILHLRHEGIVISDDHGVLRRALDAYRPPADYGILRDEFRSAALALAVDDETFVSHYKALGRLGIYLIRSYYYLKRVESGSIDFDVDSAVSDVSDSELARVVRMRRLESLTLEDSLTVRDQVLALFQISRHRNSLESVALELARRSPQAAMLVAQVISGANSLNYAATPLPPL